MVFSQPTIVAHRRDGDLGQSCRSAEKDRELVDRCLSGESRAWEELYLQFHDRLLASIKSLLAAGRADPNLVDEIAARVWYAVVADNAKLLARFQPQRGCRLTTFLAAIARGQAVEIFRSERRRRGRELVASLDRLPAEDHLDNTLAELDEFLDTLTPRERGFCAEILLQMAATEGQYSPANAWQLRSRIQRKLRRFLLGGTTASVTAPR